MAGRSWAARFDAASPPFPARVQLRRVLPTVVVQRVQRTIQNRFLSPLLAGRLATAGAPTALRVLRRYPILRAIPARLVGIGVLPEHVRVPGPASPGAAIRLPRARGRG